MPLYVYLLAMLDYLFSFVLLLPIKDERGRHRSFPYMTIGLVVINVLIHALFYYVLPWWMKDTEAWQLLRRQLMSWPAGILSGRGLGALSLITSAFLHADLLHLFSNMLYLFFFGRKLEDVLGPLKFGVFYLVCALVSGAVSVVGEATLPLVQGMIPSLGASGAIMGLMGAYLFLYHQQRIRTFLMIFVLPIPVTLRIPVWAFIVYSMARDVIRGLIEREVEVYGYVYTLVGFYAHLGGIIAGLTCIYFFLPTEILYYRRGLGEE